jgi:hypothetical protein
MFDGHGEVDLCKGSKVKEIRLALDVVGPHYLPLRPETIVEENFAIVNAVFNRFATVGRVNLHWEVHIKSSTSVCSTPETLEFDNRTTYTVGVVERCELAAQALYLRL